MSLCVVPATLLDIKYSTNGLELALSRVFIISCSFSLGGSGRRRAFKTFSTAVAPQAEAPICVTCIDSASCSDHIMNFLISAGGLSGTASTGDAGIPFTCSDVGESVFWSTTTTELILKQFTYNCNS